MEKNEFLTDVAYRAIQGELLEGSLIPGDRVSEQSLAARLGIGRTPVREAIRQFQVEGIMETITRTGTFLKMPIRNDFVEVYELREALESFASYSAAKKLDERVLLLESYCEELKQIQEELPENETAGSAGKEGNSDRLFEKYWSVDLKFHDLIAKISGNKLLTKEIGTTRSREKIFTRGFAPLTRKFISQTFSIHLWIVRAIKMREPENARSWALKHVRQEGKYVLDNVEARLKVDGLLKYERKTKQEVE